MDDDGFLADWTEIRPIIEPGINTFTVKAMFAGKYLDVPSFHKIV